MNQEPHDENPPVTNPYSTPEDAPPPVAVQSPQSSETDSTGGVIPYKNPHALISYYLAILSLLPCIGILAGIPAFLLGLSGLRKHKANPAIRGTVHAWIGISVGGTMSLIWGALLVIFFLAAAFNA